MLRVLFVLLAAVLVVGVLPSVSASAQPVAQSGQISVVTSILPIADLIKNVGGDTVQVTALVPPGGEPEDYDPTPADAKAVSQARVFFANGLGLEAYLDDLTESAGNSQLEVVTLSEGLPTLSSFGQGADEGGNPHLWLDPQNAISYVDAIERTLSRVDPANAASYQANADRYTGQLKALDASIQQQVASLPPAQRVLVTTHDAYPYFAQRYGFTYLAVINANPGRWPIGSGVRSACEDGTRKPRQGRLWRNGLQRPDHLAACCRYRRNVRGRPVHRHAQQGCANEHLPRRDALQRRHDRECAPVTMISAERPTPVQQPPALLLADVVAGYDHGVVLHGVSARLMAGQVVALMGPNGSGKSTLLKVILGLMEPISGRVEVLGSAPSRLDRRRHQIGYVPQLRDVDRAFPATVFDLAMMGRVGRLRAVSAAGRARPSDGGRCARAG